MDSNVTIVTDASTVCGGVLYKRRHGGNWDLWGIVWAIASRKNICLCAKKVTSHVLEGTVKDNRLIEGSVWDFVGNVYADDMTERGAAMAALPHTVVQTYCHTETLVSRVQMRLATLGCLMAAGRRLRTALEVRTTSHLRTLG